MGWDTQPLRHLRTTTPTEFKAAGIGTNSNYDNRVRIITSIVMTTVSMVILVPLLISITTTVDDINPALP